MPDLDHVIAPYDSHTWAARTQANGPTGFARRRARGVPGLLVHDLDGGPSGKLERAGVARSDRHEGDRAQDRERVSSLRHCQQVERSRDEDWDSGGHTGRVRGERRFTSTENY
jgi:hypothetical protein